MSAELNVERHPIRYRTISAISGSQEGHGSSLDNCPAYTLRRNHMDPGVQSWIDWCSQPTNSVFDRRVMCFGMWLFGYGAPQPLFQDMHWTGFLLFAPSLHPVVVGSFEGYGSLIPTLSVAQVITTGNDQSWVDLPMYAKILLQPSSMEFELDLFADDEEQPLPGKLLYKHIDTFTVDESGGVAVLPPYFNLYLFQTTLIPPPPFTF